MSTRIARAMHVVHEEGFTALMSKILNATVYRRLILFDRPLVDLAIPERRPLDLPISTLDIDDADAYAMLRPDQGADVFRARMRAGHVCLVARDGSRLAGHSWHTARNARIDFLDVTLPLAPDESYRYDLYTAPGYRNKGIAVAFMDESARLLSAQGYRRVLAAIYARNGESIRMTRVVGAVKIGSLSVIRLGPWRLHIVRVHRGVRAPGTPYHPSA